MVKHVAYAGDPEHEQWRISHGFPARIAFGSLRNHEPKMNIDLLGAQHQEIYARIMGGCLKISFEFG